MSETIEDMAPQIREILQTLVWWRVQTCPHHTTVYKILRLCGAISLLVFILSPSNLAILLILRRSFQWLMDFC